MKINYYLCQSLDESHQLLLVLWDFFLYKEVNLGYGLNGEEDIIVRKREGHCERQRSHKACELFNCLIKSVFPNNMISS